MILGEEWPHSLDGVIANLERRKAAEEDLIAFHSERVEDMSAQLDAFYQERDRLLGEVALDIPQPWDGFNV